jgi:hypothetical protein
MMPTVRATGRSAGKAFWAIFSISEAQHRRRGARASLVTPSELAGRGITLAEWELLKMPDQGDRIDRGCERRVQLRGRIDCPDEVVNSRCVAQVT